MSNNGQKKRTALLVLVFVLFALVAALGWLGRTQRGGELTVYCAAGLKPPVAEAARQFEAETGVRVRLQYGPSGGLESQIQIRPDGDLFIPAAVDPFIRRMQPAGLVAEVLPIARFRLVLAVRPGNDKQIQSLDDLLRGGVGYAVANEPAAVGHATRQALEKSGHWEKIKVGAKVFKPTVTEVAHDVQLGVGVDAGFIWDATAKQFGLQIVPLPELDGGESTVAVGVLTASKHPTLALQLARYLAAPEKGQAVFQRNYFTGVPGDPWAAEPEITLFSGGVNRRAIKDTIQAFAAREGCRITTVYEGCGKLVGMMKAGQQPDAYFACDASYVDKVKDLFVDVTSVSKTDMVILVRKGNPQNIHGVADLARPGLKIGIANEQLTALGDLTTRLLDEAGVREAVLKNRVATTPTADMLVVQLVANDKLDAVIVYEANCTQVLDEAEIVRIDHPAARAVQPFATNRESRYPQLVGRLLKAIQSADSRVRFEQNGFQWADEQGRP